MDFIVVLFKVRHVQAMTNLSSLIFKSLFNIIVEGLLIKIQHTVKFILAGEMIGAQLNDAGNKLLELTFS